MFVVPIPFEEIYVAFLSLLFLTAFQNLLFIQGEVLCTERCINNLDIYHPDPGIGKTRGR